MFLSNCYKLVKGSGLNSLLNTKKLAFFIDLHIYENLFFISRTHCLGSQLLMIFIGGQEDEKVTQTPPSRAPPLTPVPPPARRFGPGDFAWQMERAGAGKVS